LFIGRRYVRSRILEEVYKISDEEEHQNITVDSENVYCIL